MRKLWLIIRREFVVRVHTRTFIVTTIGLPALLIGLFAISARLATKHAGETLRLAIVDQAGGLGAPVAARLAKSKLSSGQAQFSVVATIEQPTDPEHAIAELREQVRVGSLDGYLVIPPGLLTGAKAEFHTRNSGDVTLEPTLGGAVTEAAIGARLAQDQVRVSDLNRLLEPVRINVVKISREGELQEKGETLEASLLLTVVLYSSLLMYGIATMRSILEEKSTRIMEILLSSVRSFPLLAGKILGVGAVAFTQYLIWVIAGAAIVGYGATVSAMFKAGGWAPNWHIPSALWFWFLVYFLGGYFLYASLFAAVGAAVSSERDAHQAQLPITMLLVVGYVMFPAVVRSPNSHLAVLLTMIPFFSPVLMILRIALESPPLWQLLLSVALLVLTTLGVVYLSAKIYRVGVLMYGKRP